MAVCTCGGVCENSNIIFTCSGVSNVGQLSHKMLLKAKELNIANPSCLAGLGADLQGFVVAAKDADHSIVIDGCPLACGKKIFARHNLTPSVHLVLTEHGFSKGEKIFSEEELVKAMELVSASLKNVV